MVLIVCVVLKVQHNAVVGRMKLYSPYRAECCNQCVDPGAAPDGWPQAPGLFHAFSVTEATVQLLGSRTAIQAGTAGIPARPMLVREHEEKVGASM